MDRPADAPIRSITPAEAEGLAEQGKPFTNDPFNRVFDLGDGRVIKYGSGTCKTEALAMNFVRARTSLPIPEVIAYGSDPGEDKARRTGYLVMQKLPGVPLLKTLKTLRPRDKAFVIEQLKDVVAQLRALDDPSRWGMIGKHGAFHGGFFAYGNTPDSVICRPNPSHAVADICAYFASSMHPDRRKLFFSKDGEYHARVSPALKEHASVFSHSDLRPENILVDPDTLRITGIVDWAWAGWYPRYWDRLIAYRADRSYRVEEAKVWRRIYEEVFPLYAKEAEGFNLLLMCAGEWAKQDAGIGYWCECCKD